MAIVTFPNPQNKVSMSLFVL